MPAPPDAVRGFYVDLDNIRLVHPLIVSVETLSRNETPEGYQQSYRVVDRIPLGPFTIRTTYYARLRVPASGDVLTEADQSPGVVTIREAVKAHAEMLAGIRRHFESG